MPDEYNHDKAVEEICKTLNGNRYYHDLYLKAVNHPIRREILDMINKAKKISRISLFHQLSEKHILDELSILDYNSDFLIKALCIEKEIIRSETFYTITQSGKVVEYLK